MSDIQIQLGSKRFVDAVNTDEQFNIGLKAPTVEILPYDETSTINVADLFNDERQISEVYRFYGCINFMSLANGLSTGYTGVNNFFRRPSLGAEASGITRNILNCFDFYLCRPQANLFEVTGGTLSGTTFGGSVDTRPYVELTGVTQIESGNTFISGTTYRLNYEILTNLTDIDIYKSGYNKNIFYDQVYGFNFNLEIDLRGQTDSFGKPITELYLFANFKPQKSGETVTQNTYDSSTRVTRPYVIYSGGSIVDGDWVFYLPTNFEEVLLQRSEHYVHFPCTGTTGTGISLKYNPFIPIKIRDFSDEILSGNISGTSEIDFNIPDYAINVDDEGNYIWENLLENGYIDPISLRGVNYPFINKRHYIFSNLVLPMTTDMDDPTTANAFNTISFGPNTDLFTQPTTDLNDLGEKC